jgi:multiple sugar transport system ATP-binding protein
MNMLEVTVGEAPDKWVLSTGQETFTVDRSRFGLRRGMRAILGIRPANLKLAAPDIKLNGLAGAVDLVEYLGDGVLLSIALPGDTARQISALVPVEQRPVMGTAVGFSVDPGCVHVFDAETGQSCLRADLLGTYVGEEIRDAS